MSHPQALPLHAPAPRRPIALVRKQHHHHHHHHSHHPYSLRSNTLDHPSTSRNSNGSGVGTGGTDSRGSLRRSTSPVPTKSRRSSSVRMAEEIKDKDRDVGMDEGHGSSGHAEEIRGQGSNNPPSGLPSTATSMSSFDKDRTPTRKEMASISDSHNTANQSQSSPNNSTPTGNHHPIDLKIQKSSPIDIQKAASTLSGPGLMIESQEMRPSMESPPSFKSNSPSLSVDYDHSSNHPNHHHHHSNSNSSILSSSSQSSSSSTLLSPFPNSSSNPRGVGVPIIPPSPISRNQTRNPFARHFSNNPNPPQPLQLFSDQNMMDPSVGQNTSIDSPKGKRALFLEQQEEEFENLGGFKTVNRNDDVITTSTATTTTKKLTGGNRHKLSKSEEIKMGLIGLELGLEGDGAGAGAADGDEIMRD